MPWHSLPVELKELIVEQVSLQDRRYAAEWRRKRSLPKKDGVQFEELAKVDPIDAFFRGVRAMSMVNRELYEICLPLVFEVRHFAPFSLLPLYSPAPALQPLRLDLVSPSSYKQLPTLACAQHCRTVRIGPVFDESTERGSRLLFCLDLLHQMPNLRSVELYLSEGAFDDLKKLIGRFPYTGTPGLPGCFDGGVFSFSSESNNPVVRHDHYPFEGKEFIQQLHNAAIPSLWTAAPRITSWTFGRMAGRTAAAFLRLASPCIRHISFLAEATPLPRAAEGWVPSDWWRFYSHVDGFLLRESGHLRKALRQCDHLEALEMYVYSSRRGSNYGATVHAGWLQEPFKFLSTLTSLSLTFNSRIDETVLHFFARFTALKTASLTCRGLRYGHSSPVVTLPSLTSLSLYTPKFSRITELLHVLDTPVLASLTVGLFEETQSDNIKAFFQAGKTKFCLPSFHLLRFEAVSDYRLPSSDLRSLRGALQLLNVEVETSWVPLSAGQEEAIELTDLQEVEEMAAWLTERVGRLRMGEGSEAERRRLMLAMRELADLRDVLEK